MGVAVEWRIKDERTELEVSSDPKRGALKTSAPRGLLPKTLSGLVRQSPVRGTVYLLLDHSASMADPGKMAQLTRGALRLFTEARQREYAVGIVGFARRAQLLLGATCDAAQFQKQLGTLEPYGRTAMAQAIRVATRQLRRRRGDKVILLVTDGMPNSRAATLDAAHLARAQGITVIAIGIGHADEAFLASLTPKPELAVKVAVGELENTLEKAAKRLP